METVSGTIITTTRTNQQHLDRDAYSFFLEPDWDQLWDVDIWSAAASQILFSLSVGYGSQLILASYNKINNNTHRDAFLIGVCNSVTSLYAGFVVFGILGFLAHESGTEIENVKKTHLV